MDLRKFILDNQFKITIVDNKVNILNYLEIGAFEDTKIIVRHEKGNVIITGNTLSITKLLDEEILISGEILKLEFR